jgi:hypothetical protein
VDLDLDEIETATASAVQANKQAVNVAIATGIARLVRPLQRRAICRRTKRYGPT